MNDQTAPERCDSTTATPAALLSGEVPADAAAHPLSVFDMFRIGIGPSSSHTVGPMRAGLDFTTELAGLEKTPATITIDLYGSLGATGRGHNTDRAVLLGLAGFTPEHVSISEVESLIPRIENTGQLNLPGGLSIPFNTEQHIRFLPDTVLPYHVNALTITAYTTDSHEQCSPEASGSASKVCRAPDEGGNHARSVMLRRTYYSVGGGFAMIQSNDDSTHPEVAALVASQSAATLEVPAPHPFSTGTQLLAQCREHGLSIADIVRRNEESMRSAEEIDSYLDSIADSMFDCIDAGCSASGTLPGGLNVPRRAKGLAEKLFARTRDESSTPSGPEWTSTAKDPMRAMDWVNLFALAVNEENAAGHRIVTAPTNGAAGVVPAVLGYLVSYCPEGGASLDAAHVPCEEGTASAPFAAIRFCAQAEGARKHQDTPTAGKKEKTEDSKARACEGIRRRAVHNFLLAATAIGALIKTNASIAGAEVGCQGEVGSASAMAAAGLAQALGGTPEQVENAAEIAMEHSLGLTCDPVAGLVQIPCIERNAIAAVKAINAARMALWSDGRHHVSFDAVIETMRQTGIDMLSKYKETSAGGLAVNVVEC